MRIFFICFALFFATLQGLQVTTQIFPSETDCDELTDGAVYFWEELDKCYERKIFPSSSYCSERSVCGEEHGEITSFELCLEDLTGLTHDVTGESYKLSLVDGALQVEIFTDLACTDSYAITDLTDTCSLNSCDFYERYVYDTPVVETPIEEESDDSDDLEDGALAGIVVGSSLGTLLLFLIPATLCLIVCCTCIGCLFCIFEIILAAVFISKSYTRFNFDYDHLKRKLQRTEESDDE